MSGGNIGLYSIKIIGKIHSALWEIKKICQMFG
jgi:hypothetical protein